MKLVLLALASFGCLASCAVGSTPTSDTSGTGGSGTGSSVVATNSTGSAFGSASSSGSGGAGILGSCVPSKATEYSGPGPDGVWGTADDVVSQYQTLTHDTTGWPSVELEYTGPGPDGAWGTADDVLQNKGICTGDPAAHLDTCVSWEPGPDSTWNTPDDEAYVYVRYEYDPSNQRIIQANGFDAGPDGTIMTADDRQIYFETIFWMNGHPDHIQYSSAAGPDGQWGTADDVISESDTYEYDGSGKLSAIVFHSSPGPDGVWGTSDDPVKGALDSQCSQSNSLTEIGATAAGLDGLWGTTDDTLSTSHTVLDGDGCGLSCVPPIN